MYDETDLDLTGIGEKLTSGRIMVLRVVAGCLALGIVGLFVFVLVFNFKFKSGQADTGLGVVKMLTILHYVMWVATLWAGWFFYKRFTNVQMTINLMRLQSVRRGSKEEGFLKQYAEAMVAGTIIRLAVYESAALFGLVICFLAKNSGVMAEQPIYWINVSSAVFFVLFVIATFPSKERFERIIENQQMPRV